MNKNIQKITAVTLLAGLLGTFTHCVQQAPVIEEGTMSKQSNNPSFDSSSSSGSTMSSTGIIAATSQAASVGVKNFDEINTTMSYLTGVPKADVAATFNTLAPALPNDNDVQTYITTTQVAVTRLASNYCQRLFVDTGNIDHSDQIIPPAWLQQKWSLVSQDTRREMIANLLDAFWGEGVDDAGRMTDLEEILETVNETSAGEPDTATTTRKVIAGAACTPILASVQIILK